MWYRWLTCKTDCSAKPMRSFPANDLIRYLASVLRQATNNVWILSSFFARDYIKETIVIWEKHKYFSHSCFYASIVIFQCTEFHISNINHVKSSITERSLITECPVIWAISFNLAYTLGTVNGAGWNIVLWLDLLLSATIPKSPICWASALIWASVLPVHCAIAFIRFMSATPSSIPMTQQEPRV